MDEKLILKDILTIIDDLKYGESISIEDLIKSLNWEEEEILKVVSVATKFYILIIDSRAYYDGKIEKHTRITGIDRDGHIIFDLLKNPELMKQVIKEFPALEECSIFTVATLMRKCF